MGLSSDSKREEVLLYPDYAAGGMNPLGLKFLNCVSPNKKANFML
jgi:hypothetical protein